MVPLELAVLTELVVLTELAVPPALVVSATPTLERTVMAEGGAAGAPDGCFMSRAVGRSVAAASAHAVLSGAANANRSTRNRAVNRIARHVVRHIARGRPVAATVDVVALRCLRMLRAASISLQRRGSGGSCGACVDDLLLMLGTRNPQRAEFLVEVRAFDTKCLRGARDVPFELSELEPNKFRLDFFAKLAQRAVAILS